MRMSLHTVEVMQFRKRLNSLSLVFLVLSALLPLLTLFMAIPEVKAQQLNTVIDNTDPSVEKIWQRLQKDGTWKLECWNSSGITKDTVNIRYDFPEKNKSKITIDFQTAFTATNYRVKYTIDRPVNDWIDGKDNTVILNYTDCKLRFNYSDVAHLDTDFGFLNKIFTFSITVYNLNKGTVVSLDPEILILELYAGGFSYIYLENYHPSATTKWSAFGQAFNMTLSAPYNLTKVAFFFGKNGSPHGNGSCALYDYTGTYGSTAKPTGSALAVTNSKNVSTLTTGQTWYNFTFTTAYTMQPNTVYCLAWLNPASGQIDATDEVEGKRNDGGIHDGNFFYYKNSGWITWAKRKIHADLNARIHPKKLQFVLQDGTEVWITPNDKKGSGYHRLYMREYRRRVGYLAGRKIGDYNRYMRRYMRTYRLRR